MSDKKFLVNLDINGNQIKNVVVESVAVDPAVATAGRIIYNSTSGELKVGNGTTWISAKKTASNVVTDETGVIYGFYNGETAGEFKFRAITTGKRADNSKPLTLSMTDGVITIDIDLIKEDVGLGNVTNDAQVRQTQLSTAATLKAAPEDDVDGTIEPQDGLVPSQKAVKTYVDTEIAKVESAIAGGTSYIGAWDASKTIAENLEIHDIGTVAAPCKIGYMFKVTVAGTASGIHSPSHQGLEIGDMVICNSNIDNAATATADMFDAIDNTDAADMVRLDATQTLTNKTIDADNNNISNLTTGAFKSGVIVDDITGSEELSTKIASTKGIKKALDDYKAAVSDLKAEAYSTEVTELETVSVTAAVHGCGLSPIVQVYQKVGTDYFQVETSVKVTASGTVTVDWNGAATAENPIKVIITGVA